jgi:hypothetical protein
MGAVEVGLAIWTFARGIYWAVFDFLYHPEAGKPFVGNFGIFVWLWGALIFLPHLGTTVCNLRR